MGEITTYLRYWAAKKKLNIILIRTNSFGSYKSEIGLSHCDAYISVLNSISPELAAKLPPEKPFIAVGSNDYDKCSGVERVFSNHRQGINRVFEHLYDLGHRDIGYLGDFNIVDMRLRHHAYKENIEKFGLEYHEEYVLRAQEPSMEGGREASEIFLRDKPGITALITSADLMALGFIQGLASEGLRCPDDIAITGYEATSLGRKFDPSITSVNQHMCEVIEKGLERIVLRLQGEPMSRKDMYIDQELYIGTSCGADKALQLDEDEFIRRRSSHITAFQNASVNTKNNESLVAFAKAGFESLISTSYLFGPFLTEGFRARWQGEDIQTWLNIYSHFSFSGHLPLSGKVRFQASEFPPLTPVIEGIPYILTLLPISVGDTDWEVIALFDDQKKNDDYDNLALFYNYLDMISFSLERDAYALISHRKEEESRILAKQILELNNTLEAKVEQRTNELNRLNQSLQEKNKELEEVSQYKTDFISNMSHELRTPLNSIVGFTRRLLRLFNGEDDPKVTESLNAIDRNSVRLIELINDVLDVSKMEAGYLSLNVTRTELVNLVESVAKDLYPLADAKNLKMEVKHSTTHENIYSQVDPMRISQVVMNLISNAIKYTDEGTIDIEVGMTHYKQLGLCNFISVRDSGMGIPEKAIDKLFGKFGRLEKHERSDIVGTGLGLAIVKEIITLHRGHVEVDSVEGRGSNFTVYLPG